MKDFNNRIQEKRELDKQKEIEREEAMKNAPQDEENKNANMEMTVEEEKIEIKPFEKIEKKFVLCLDTLGQDRLFDENEMLFINKVAKSIKTSWESLEENLLLKDRNIRIEMNDIEAKFKEAVSLSPYI